MRVPQIVADEPETNQEQRKDSGQKIFCAAANPLTAPERPIRGGQSGRMDKEP